MKNRGFTLIELLAVIIILAIIMLIAIPSVTNYINNSRKESYVDTAKELLRGAGNLVNSGELEVYDPGTTYYIPSTCIKTESGGNSPYGKFNPAYIITTYDGENHNYYWISKDEASMGVPKPVSGDELSKEHIVPDVDTVSTDYGVGSRDNIVLFNSDCSSSITKAATGRYSESDLSGRVTPIRKCQYNGELNQGAEFVDGQYTYRYQQKYSYNNWANIDDDGWGVILTDKETSEDIDTPLCTLINDKPIVAMDYMFANAVNVGKIDATSYDTSNVTTMRCMFQGAFQNSQQFEIKGIEDFDTSKVKSFGYMFDDVYNSNIDTFSLNLSKWDVSSLTEISYMFYGFGQESNNVKINLKGWTPSSLVIPYSPFNTLTGKNSQNVDIDMSNWNLPNVTNMYYFLGYSGAYANSVTLDVTGWKFPKLTTLSTLFYLFANGANKAVIKGLDTWDTSNITNMYYMFNWLGGAEFEIDLSSWDVSKVTDLRSMFRMSFTHSSENVKIILKNWSLNPNVDVTDMFAYALSGCKEFYIDLSGWNLNGKTTLEQMFTNVGSSSNKAEVNMSGWNTTGLTSMNRFAMNSFLGALNVVFDVTGWDTSSLTSMNYAFRSAGGRPDGKYELKGIANWDLRNCTNFESTFEYASNIFVNNLNIHSANTKNMFYGASNTKGKITIHNNPTDYTNMLTGTSSTTSFVVDYTSSVTDIDNIITTNHNYSANVVKGSLVS